MLCQASVSEIKGQRLTRSNGFIAIVMRHYPRGLVRTLCDDYLRVLAPDATLFDDFMAAKERLSDHNQAFAEVDYERRFGLSEAGMVALERLAGLAHLKDVYLVCQCARTERCHRELLLILAHSKFRCEIDRVRFQYPQFEQRLPKL